MTDDDETFGLDDELPDWATQDVEGEPADAPDDTDFELDFDNVPFE
jgi:hypothetical protein